MWNIIMDFPLWLSPNSFFFFIMCNFKHKHSLYQFFFLQLSFFFKTYLLEINHWNWRRKKNSFFWWVRDDNWDKIHFNLLVFSFNCSRKFYCTLLRMNDELFFKRKTFIPYHSNRVNCMLRNLISCEINGSK